MSIHSEIKRVTTHTLQWMKQNNEKISMLTAYDYSMASILDAAGIDVLLVGDSASNVMAGNSTTLPITLDHMIYHAQSVMRGIERCLVIVDLPFGSYQGNSKKALESAIRVMKETGAHAVKLEGGLEIRESIERIITLNLATTNTDKLLSKIEDALAKGGIEAAKDVTNNTKGPVASIFTQGLMRSSDGIDMVEKSLVSYGGVEMARLERGLIWVSLFISLLLN